MITRRTFLKASVGSAAGLMLPSWLARAETYIKTENAPFLEPPGNAETTIYAVDHGGNNYMLALGEPADELPRITWRELLKEWHGCESFEEFLGTDDPEYLCEYNLDDIAPEWEVLDYWITAGSEYARAFRFLEPLDLGFDFDGENGTGEINFVEGPSPGNDSVFVTVPDHISISLLQKRLNQIDGTVRVAVHAL